MKNFAQNLSKSGEPVGRALSFLKKIVMGKTRVRFWFLIVIVAVIVAGISLFSNKEMEFVEPKVVLDNFMAAGVPKYIGESHDYDKIFTELNNSGMKIFFPTFQYQEVPEAKSLNYEADFLVPCTSDSPAFKGLRQYGIKLLVPGELIYNPISDLPPLSDDPLKEIINCAGREAIAGVMSYDEPFWRDYLKASENLYRRVKEVDPTIPVYMVQGPLPSVVIDGSTKRPITESEVQYYFQIIKKYNRYADIIGFDVYPIPMKIAQVTTPYAGGATLDHKKTVYDYAKWLKENSGGKPYFMALQAFSYEKLGQDWMLEPTAGSKFPTKTELIDMVSAAKENGASIFWWGQSFLSATSTDINFWNTIKEVSR